MNCAFLLLGFFACGRQGSFFVFQQSAVSGSSSFTIFHHFSRPLQLREDHPPPLEKKSMMYAHVASPVLLPYSCGALFASFYSVRPLIPHAEMTEAAAGQAVDFLREDAAFGALALVASDCFANVATRLSYFQFAACEGQKWCRGRGRWSLTTFFFLYFSKKIKTFLHKTSTNSFFPRDVSKKSETSRKKTRRLERLAFTTFEGL